MATHEHFNRLISLFALMDLKKASTNFQKCKMVCENLGDKRHHDLFNSNKQKECCLITIKYSSPLHFHFHEFVMQASTCKRDSGSAEYSFFYMVLNESRTEMQ